MKKPFFAITCVLMCLFAFGEWSTGKADSAFTGETYLELQRKEKVEFISDLIRNYKVYDIIICLNDKGLFISLLYYKASHS